MPALIGLVLAGLAGNYFKFPLFLNIDFLFGSIFAMLALQMLGLGRGVLAGVLIASYTYVLWNHPYAAIIMTAEVAVVGVLMARRKMGMVLADIVYWLLLGLPLVFVFYYGVLQVPPSSVTIIMTKQAFNGVANALLARLLFSGVGALRRHSRISFAELIGNLFAAFLLFPALLLLFISAQSDITEIDQSIRSTLDQKSRTVTNSLADWVGHRAQVVVGLTELAASLSPREMQGRLEQALASDSNFLRIGMRDTESVIKAYTPLLDESGQSNVGKKFPERPYIAELKKTGKPMLAEVVMGRINTPEPIAILLAPVIRAGKYAGYVNSVLQTDQIRKQLDILTAGDTLLYTLIDKKGQVILSNRSNQKPMESFIRDPGKLSFVEGNINLWVPVLPPNTSISDQWKSSVYIAQTTVGDIGGWQLMLEQPVAPFQKQLYDRYAGRLLFLFVILFAALALSEWLARRTTSTIERLGTITKDLPRKLGDDKQDMTWPGSQIVQIQRLIENFKTMADSLTQQFRVVHEANASLEQRVAERTAELTLSQVSLNAILNDTNVHMWTFDGIQYTYLNKQWFDYTGQDPNGGFGTELWSSVVHPDDLPLASEVWLKNWEAKAEHDNFFRLRRHDGVYRDFHCHALPVFNAQGVFQYFQGFNLDITDRKGMEDALRDSEQRLRQFIEGNASVMMLLDPVNGKIEDVNPAAEAYYGYTREQLLTMRISDINTMAPELIAMERQLAKRQERRHFLFQHRLASGELRDVEVYSSPIQSEGRLLLFSIVHDNTERKRAEVALRLSEEKYRQLINSSHDIIYTLDAQGVFTFVSAAWTELLGYPLNQVLGHPFAPFVHPDDLPTCYAALQSLFETGERQSNVEYRVKHLDGSWRWHSTNAVALKDSGGMVISFEGNAKDITEHKQYEEQVHRLAYFDALTGLPNRRMLDDRLNQAMAVSKRSGLYGALMFLDLDNFKPLNDNYGHDVGDLLLIEVAHRLSACLRAMDTVARFGGDEFVVMLSELDVDKSISTEQARGVAEKIRASVAAPYLLQVSRLGQPELTVEHHCSASIGVVVFVNHEAGQNDIMKWADAAMYKAKGAGRNSICFHDIHPKEVAS